MPKLIDLTGKRFGRWTVLERDNNNHKHKKVYWICQCDCGNIKSIASQTLRDGESTSCGCYQKEIAKQIGTNQGGNNKVNLLGQIFGELTVIEETQKRTKNGGLIWKCKCNCGNIIEVSSANLRNKKTTHCGCKNIISKGEEKIKDLLKQNNISYISQYTNHNCIYPNTHNPARFDFFVNNSYIIEYDGDLHFEEAIGYGWNTKEKYEYTKLHDDYKNQWCKDNNIPLIRIPYTHYYNICLEDLLPETSKFLL